MKKENKLCRTECFGAKPEARQKKKGNEIIYDLENNEEKRSTLWRTIVAISSILIVIVAVFFCDETLCRKSTCGNLGQ